MNITKNYILWTQGYIIWGMLFLNSENTPARVWSGTWRYLFDYSHNETSQLEKTKCGIPSDTHATVSVLIGIAWALI